MFQSIFKINLISYFLFNVFAGSIKMIAFAQLNTSKKKIASHTVLLSTVLLSHPFINNIKVLMFQSIFKINLINYFLFNVFAGSIKMIAFAQLNTSKKKIASRAVLLSTVLLSHHLNTNAKNCMKLDKQNNKKKYIC